VRYGIAMMEDACEIFRIFTDDHDLIRRGDWTTENHMIINRFFGPNWLC
jgi:hypothetical protein